MIAIIVPVLRRAHQIEKLLENIAAATSVDYRVVFVCSPGDKEAKRECQRSEADTIVTSWDPGHGDFAKKINLAYSLTEEEWLFQAATDLVFKTEWDKNALKIAETVVVGVVGTNDLGNPAVKRGHHSTHTLFSRNYIETYGGGCCDGTGIVFSEQYSHQFCDTEFIQIAIMRKQFRSSVRSVVEHLHPHWNKSEMDETYEKSFEDYSDDAELYRFRIKSAKDFVNQEKRTERKRVLEARIGSSSRAKRRRR